MRLFEKQKLVPLKGNEYEDAYAFLGIPYAKAKRFEYCEIINHYDDIFDTTRMGNVCPQIRNYYPHLENPARMFYYKEFREGIEFKYEEDCLNLNIYVPKNKTNCPVILYFHGGGFNSGSNVEEPFRGEEYAKRGIITVFANYRVGVLGYFAHEEIQKQFHRNGNFGLDDQLQAIKWVKEHIAEFGGDKENITLLGQSAGAISIHYHCLNHENKELFQRAIMLSGAGLYPRFLSPKKEEDTYDYWHEFMDLAGCKTLEEFKHADVKILHDAYEAIRQKRNDSMSYMSPIKDGYLLKEVAGEKLPDPLKMDYMLGYTNCDLYAPFMAYLGNQFAKKNSAYVYYFDVDAPGDDNRAFHSCELRYVFGRLDQSWRPYRKEDQEVSNQMMDYIANFARNGNPNQDTLPIWNKTDQNHSKVLCVGLCETKMSKPSYFKMVRNMLAKGLEPKYEIPTQV